MLYMFFFSNKEFIAFLIVCFGYETSIFDRLPLTFFLLLIYYIVLIQCESILTWGQRYWSQVAFIKLRSNGMRKYYMYNYNTIISIDWALGGKTWLQGFRQDENQTSLLSLRD